MSTSTKIIAGAVAALLLVLIGFIMVSDYTYSDGMRKGTVSKLSRKGLLCKTWEGELAMENFSRDGTLGSDNRGTDNTFYFSVDDKRTAELVQNAMREHSVVNLGYEQKLFPMSWAFPGLCQRRTEYEVHEVTPVPGAKPHNAPMAPPPRTP
jgi:hypothetical protein